METFEVMYHDITVARFDRGSPDQKVSPIPDLSNVGPHVKRFLSSERQRGFDKKLESYRAKKNVGFEENNFNLAR